MLNLHSIDGETFYVSYEIMKISKLIEETLGCLTYEEDDFEEEEDGCGSLVDSNDDYTEGNTDDDNTTHGVMVGVHQQQSYPRSRNAVLVPLPKVKGSVLRKVVEFCAYYQDNEPMREIVTPLTSDRIEDLVQEWYCIFSDVDNVMKYEILSAANYMNIQPLVDLMCLRISVMIKGKSAEELRRIFNIPETLTYEEEQEILEENAWAMLQANQNNNVS